MRDGSLRPSNWLPSIWEGGPVQGAAGRLPGSGEGCCASGPGRRLRDGAAECVVFVGQLALCGEMWQGVGRPGWGQGCMLGEPAALLGLTDLVL